ncbi:hypothetical protein BGX34_009612 [Mortierella sp. NVP85]|nr:hypothetical protein BGX34_009612 [Mortierella sp. NVP85]
MLHVRPGHITSDTPLNAIAADDLLILGFRCRRPLPGISTRVSTKSELRFTTQYDAEGRVVTSLASHWASHIYRDVLRRGEVHVKLEVMNLLSGCVLPNFEFILCVPHNNADEIKMVKISDLDGYSGLEAHLMEHGHCLNERLLFDKHDSEKYDFDLVLATSEMMPSALLAHDHSTISEKKSSDSNNFKDMFPDMFQRMLRLLKDPGLVNVAFVFNIHSCQRRVALWANSTVLDKYPRLQELFGVADYNPVTIPIEGISLTTFCVLLKYLYTEDLQLDIDPSEFLICDVDLLPQGASRTLLSSLSTPVLNKALKKHNVAQFYATWTVKDKTTWSDLFLAADRFEIADLRKRCLENLLASVDESNAMEILFGVGTYFKEEVREPVMHYISEHLEDIFSIQTNDPFRQFAHHEGCYEVMLELLSTFTQRIWTLWNIKDKVAWSDLFHAADRFEITELRKQCLENLLASVGEGNAIEILFGVGMRFKEEIREPVMGYISENLKDVFAIQIKGPFKRFCKS